MSDKDIADTMALDKKRVDSASAKAADAAAKAKVPPTQAETDHKEFLGSLGGVSANKAKSVLDTIVSADGVPMTRKSLIDKHIERGASVVQAKGGRRLAGKDGAFLDEKAITKTGMDYADFRAKKRDSK